MNLHHVILGEVVTEKGERSKAKRVHLLRVHPDATKIEIKSALRQHFDVEVRKVRVLRVRPKRRLVGRGRTMEKRHASKRAYVTLDTKSKALDLTNVQTL